MALLTEGEVAAERLCPRNSALAAAMAAILAHNLCEMQCSEMRGIGIRWQMGRAMGDCEELQVKHMKGSVEGV